MYTPEILVQSSGHYSHNGSQSFSLRYVCARPTCNKCTQSSNTYCIHVYSEDELFTRIHDGRLHEWSAIAAYKGLMNGYILDDLCRFLFT